MIPNADKDNIKSGQGRKLCPTKINEELTALSSSKHSADRLS